MTNTTGSLVGARESGILDCITYIAGISGSCWALGVLYSGIANKLGHPDPHIAAAHIKDRVSKSFFDTITLDLLTNPPTNKVKIFTRSFDSLLIAAPLVSPIWITIEGDGTARISITYRYIWNPYFFKIIHSFRPQFTQPG
jgi:hypothetical protein